MNESCGSEMLVARTLTFLSSMAFVPLPAIGLMFSKSANQTLFVAMLSAALLSAVQALFFSSGDASVANGRRERASAPTSSGPLMQ